MRLEDMDRDQLLAEVKLAHEECAHLEEYVRASPAAIVALDRQGKVREWNAAAERLFGWTRDEVLRRRMPAVPRRALGQFRMVVERSLEADGLTDLSVMALTKDGSRLHISLSTAPVHDSTREVNGFVAVAVDTTERQRAQGALAESEERYRCLVEMSPDAIAVHSQGTVVFANSAALRLLGGSVLGDVVGKPVMDFVHPDYRRFVAARLKRMTREGPDLVPAEEKFVRLDGTAVDVEVASSPMSYEGKPAFLVVFRDITERKHVERLKTDFASMVSHELRTPLTTIVGYADLLSRIDPRKNWETYERTVERLRTRAGAMNRMVEDILNASRIETGRLSLLLEDVDMGDLVKACVETAEMAPTHAVTLQVQERLPAVRCDSQRVGYALSNLLSNAAKFSPDGGAIGVSVDLHDSRVRVSVADEGVGIAPEDLPHIFDRFTQADMSSTRSFGGFGLGLFIARQIVQAHGGTIEAASRPDKGAIFSIELPVGGAD